MALTQMDDFTFKHVDQVDTPVDNADTIKTNWDSRGVELRTFINNLIGIFNSTTAGNSGTENIAARAIAGVTGATAYAQILDVKTQLDAAILGAIPDGSLTTVKLADGAVTAAKVAADVATQAELDDLAGAGRTTETVKGNADALASHLNDYAYQTPTIIGTQIQITKQSDTKRLFFVLAADLSGGAITISLDGGTSDLPLQDIDGNAVTELSKGFVEVVADATFFTLRPRDGLKLSDTTERIYIIQAGETIEKGDALVLNFDGTVKKSIPTIKQTLEKEFSSNGISNASVIALNESKLLIAYDDGGDTYKGKVVVAQISGNTVTFGTPVVFHSASYAQHFALARISDNKAIIAYVNYSDKDVNVAIIDVTDTTATVTGNIEIMGGAYDYTYLDVDIISENQAIVCANYAASAGQGHAMIVDINGSVITSNTRYTIKDNGEIRHVSVHVVDSSRALITFIDEGNNYYETAQVLSISGTTISINTEIVINTNGNTNSRCNSDLLADNKAILVSADVLNYYNLWLIDINGVSLTVDTPISTGELTNQVKVTTLTNKKVIICDNTNDSNNQRILAYSIGEDDSIILADKYVTENIGTNINIACRVSDGFAGVVHEDDTNVSGIMYLLNFSNVIDAIAKENGSGGETIKSYTW